MTDKLAKTYDPSKFEEELYQWWEENGYFKPEKQDELGITTKSSKPFINTIPPPNVTGKLHLGHGITFAIQDLMVRYARMNGCRALFLPGSDHAGIATQNVVERELDKQGIKRKEMGREKFIEKVWEWKEKSHAIITKQSKKLGLSSDWDREAFTLDDNLSRAVRTAFVRMYEKDLIYRGNYLVNWCPGRCESAISSLEAEIEDVSGHLWYMRYPIKTKNWEGPQGQWGSGSWAKGATDFIEVATTRPETLLGDSAVAINDNHPRFKKYKGMNAVLPVLGREIEVIIDNSVDPEFGTGAVKITPSHDFNDYEMGKRHKLEFYTILDEKAVVLDEFGGKYAGLDRFDARKLIVKDLETEGLLIKIEAHVHALPHCQRCHTIIEPRDSLQWFVRTTPLASKVIEKLKLNAVNFIPDKYLDRMLQWLNPETFRDWCISRQLWWGHRIPIWYCGDCGEASTGMTDPTECSNCRSTELSQDEDVLDTWFSSGLWPFSTLGWPEKTQDMEDFYPNQMRETGYDILSFWVARELMLGLELTGEIPYENVYFHGLVRNEAGRKISKSMENIDEYDPLNIIAKYGADTLRYTLVSYSSPGLDMNLDPKNIDSSHKFGNKLWQITKFILGNIPDNFELEPLSKLKLSELELADRWILSQLFSTIKRTTQYIDDFNYLEAAREIKRFSWSLLADWYIEISKIRLYAKDNSQFNPIHILVHSLDNILRLLHPFMPFLSEKLWQELPHQVKDQEALIVAQWPKVMTRFINQKIDDQFSTIMNIVSAIRGIRGEFTVSHSKEIDVIIDATGSADKVKAGAKEIISLAKLNPNGLTIKNNITAPDEVISAVAEGMTIYIPLEGLVEAEKELARLDKQIIKLDKMIAGIVKKLGGQFVQRAPPELVNKEKTKLEGYRQDRSTLVTQKEQFER